MSACVSFLAERFAADRVQQQARGDAAVAGILLDQRARGEDRRTCAPRPSARRRTGRLQRRLEDRARARRRRQAGAGRRRSARSAAPMSSGTRDAVVDDDAAAARRPPAPALPAPARAPARAVRGTARRRARPRARRRASAPSSTWSWMSSMWNVPPPGWRAHQRARPPTRSARRPSRARAPTRRPALPFTARNALVIATAILFGSKPTTAPLRRMILYWASADRCSPRVLRSSLRASGCAVLGRMQVAGRAGDLHRVFSCLNLMVLGFPAPPLGPSPSPSSAGAVSRVPTRRRRPRRGPFARGFRKSLTNQNLLYLVFKC